MYTVDADALEPTARAGEDADRSTRQPENFGEELDEGVVGRVVDRRRRDANEDRVVPDAVDRRLLRSRDDADVDLDAGRSGCNLQRTCVQT